MSAANIVLESLKAGVHLFSEGGKLGFKVTSGHFPDDLKSKVVNNKAQIITYLEQLKDSTSSLGSRVSIEPRTNSEHDTYPASFAQQRLYFIDQLSSGNQYTSIDLFRISGVFNLESCQRAFAKLIERHLPLRTVYFENDLGVQQRILSSFSFELRKTHIKSAAQDPEERDVHDAAGKLANIAFDLTSELPIRVEVLIRSKDEHILLLSQHHIATDGWSNNVLLSEWQQLYQQFSDDQGVYLEPLAIDYVDYALWQKALFNEGKVEKQVEYWRSHLRGMPLLHKISTDFARKKQPNHAGGNHCFRLNNKDLEQLRALAKRSNVTIFMLVHAIFSVLLYRVTGDGDIVIGSPVANRRDQALEGLIGLFVNTLVLRLKCEPEVTFDEFLKQVKAVNLAALDNQDVPFEHLVEIINPPRTLSYSPLIQIVFTLSQAGTTQPQTTNISVEPIKPECLKAKFDLNLNAIEYSDFIEFNFQYSSELFSADSIELLSGQLVTLINSVCMQPSCQLSKLNLVKDTQKKMLLESIVDKSNTYPVVDCLDEIFSNTAIQFSQHSALNFNDVELTYNVLDEQSNQLAHYLVAENIKCGDKVGVCLPRSHHAIIAILAILKVGAIYVPLDPANPDSRLSYIALDSQVSRIITSPDTSKTALFDKNIQINLSAVLLKEFATTKPVIKQQRSVSDPAYIIYTSGSTGKPKGVVVSHQNVARLFYAVEHNFNFNDQDVWTMFHSYAFDFSVWEIWGALFYGGKLVVIDEQTTRDPQAFYDLVVAQKVTVLSQTPSAFVGFDIIDKEQRQTLSLKHVVFGGEALQLSSLKGWYARHDDNDPILVNMYGTTETTVHATYKKLTKSNITQNRASIIGRSLSDLSIYILDTDGKLVPNGIAGEMYIGGSGVSFGYYNKADLTSQRFIPNPYIEGDILYKTGDGARVNLTGELEYLGRLDNQVQVRGFRVELSEIEAQILELSSITSAIVIYKEGADANKNLIAYIVSESNDRANEASYIAEVKAELANILPKYMIPNMLILLDKLPTTVNGKIDKSALPDIDNILSNKSIVLPRNSVETALVSIWSEALKLPQLCIYDNYFTLGGDSIKVLSLIALAKKQGFVFSVQDLYKNQTVEKLAKVVSTGERKTVQLFKIQSAEYYLSSIKDLDNSHIEDAYPTTMMQRIMLEKHGLYEGVEGVYLPQSVFEIKKRDFSTSHFRDAIDSLITQIPALRSTFIQCEKHGYIQLVHNQFDTNFEVVDLAHLSPVEQQEYAKALRCSELKKPFTINDSCHSLIRFVVVRYNQSHYEVIVSSHHAIEDGWGMVTFFNELMQNYQKRISQLVPAVSVLANNSFKEHVCLELGAIAEKAKHSYWRQKLQENPSETLSKLTLCGDKNGLGKVGVTFEGEYITEISKAASKHHVQKKALFLQCFKKALVAQFNMVQFSIDILTSGRSEHLSNPLNSMGLFWSFCPLFCHSDTSNQNELLWLQNELNRISTNTVLPYQYAVIGEAEVPNSQISYKFVQFHHAEDHDGSQTVAAEDRFHYPLNLSVGLSNCEQLCKLELNFNEAYVSPDIAKQVLSLMEIEIKKIIKE
ncbi:non-ribosomal peptide synthetase [Pseudoalteromonas aurantia]|uniref:Carrier domain-containing protein n=2 Tax=Pseudoalteromonas TaxID=53246 RepID=A0A5S3VCW0_9GAMM|nr:non-ribosomal peptide synthetase [Pseudoalteromonas aurantia]TMO69884.1 hypothetical protein CWC19_03345 [Pseudoalteromonas aurantia]TMO75137.1 hypothetical protein CWC20_08690 [Pseudoalteromonas aurantia]